MSRKSKIILLLLLDSIVILLANILSFIYLAPYVEITYLFCIGATVIQLVLYIVFGWVLKIFTRINRYTNISEILDITSAMTLAIVLTFLLLSLTGETYSRRYVVLSYLLSVFIIVLNRLIWRVIVDSQTKKNGPCDRTKKTLIIGAGNAGRILINSLTSSASHSDISIVGLIDDAQDKFHTYLSGIRVLGKVADIPKLLSEYEVDMITIAIPSLAPSELKGILESVTPLGLQVNLMPSLEEIATGNITTSRLRSVDVIDLLGREEVDLDLKQLTNHLQNKKVLVTGAGGSIGSELCRQLIQFQPKELILVGHGENSIYLIERELSDLLEKQTIELTPVIADIQDKERMEQVMSEYRPDIIYHAAAHKHVPLMEYNPKEAVKNNIYGSKNVAEAAKKFGVTTFVMISTDKAVNPPNVMGATKRIAEMIITELNEEGKTTFCAVRFGNVLGSRGSVIPVFEKQIKAGGPVTITDFRMTRYFMTISEASKLVIQAGSLARGGEIFILDMGEPVRIIDLAKNMIRLSGYKENQIEIVEMGIRPGEKLYEELLASKERTDKQVFEKIFVGNVRGFSLQRVLSFVQNLPSDAKEAGEEVVRFANESSK